MLRTKYIPTGPVPEPEQLHPARIVRYIGPNEVFTHSFHGIRVIFCANEDFGGEKVLVVDRKDVLHSLLSIGYRSGDPQFEIAEDLEELADEQDMLSAIAKHPEKVAKLIFPYIVALADDGDEEEKPKKRKRRTKAEIEADNTQEQLEGDDQ